MIHKFFGYLTTLFQLQSVINNIELRSYVERSDRQLLVNDKQTGSLSFSL
jgi:hypothetical protein